MVDGVAGRTRTSAREGRSQWEGVGVGEVMGGRTVAGIGIFAAARYARWALLGWVKLRAIGEGA